MKRFVTLALFVAVMVLPFGSVSQASTTGSVSQASTTRTDAANQNASVKKHRVRAICRDGTYSYSHNRRGTCSWHGGVKKWFY